MAKRPTGKKPSEAANKPFELPALSVYKPPKLTDSEFDKLKKKTIRRNAPPGEDLKQIKAILRSIKGQNIAVQEFIRLMAPSTGDRGECLRIVMQEDLNAFRKLARKVYETITQDNSDVLLNQQQQLVEYYQEKRNLLHDKMMRAIEQIYLMAPNFCFDTYEKEGEKYLEKLFPIPEEIILEPEEMEALKRQAAYHRLQWLRSEGERLNEENNKLKQRLNQLKQMHREEQFKMSQMEQQAEAKRESLEAAQAQKVEVLEKLNESLQKSIIEQETHIRMDTDAGALQQSTGGKKAQKKKSKGSLRKRPAWNEDAAKEIETKALIEGQAGETRTVRARSPFHFSPIKTPPQKQAPPKERSPFHYSPPPDQRALSPPPRPRPPAQQCPPPAFGRRGAQAPRDSWGGFY